MIQLRKSEGRERCYCAEGLLAAGFLAVILVGTALLALPAATRSGQSIGLFDSLFTATSAVCVTGLVAVDTGATFSPFGQAVLLALIQVGGLGFMMFANMIMVMLGRKITLRGRMLIRESMSSASLSDLSGLAKLYLFLALGIELAGACVLAIRFVPMFGFKRGLWMALFHAVSAFCNAGFDLFGRFQSLTAFAGDPLVLLTVAALIILGGLGFSVVLEALRNRQGFRNLSLHARIVLLSTLLLLVTGTLFFLLIEGSNAGTLAGQSAGGKVLNAFFQSVTLRTAGFNTVDQALLKDSSKLLGSLMMAVGASPASTGGGMKTTTVAVLFFLMLGVVKGEKEVNVARRRISDDTVR
ncbi:MAG: Trk family potassium uptake protein, partial [Clostridia bacterium]|nr:Trk family potassium uptake protein [Clostridia bacterium]